jgi:ribose-phosphate pyrophosphokinase
MNLNLDPAFQPFLGDNIKFETFSFPGGEQHIKLQMPVQLDHSYITHRARSFKDIELILLAADALRRIEAKNIELLLPYFPAARQDRVMVKGEPLSVKVYADLINSVNFDRVIIFDPHSEVTPALLNNCEVLYNHEFIKTVIENIGHDLCLVSPDGGALKKIYKVSEYAGGIDVVECSKMRDVKTGALAGFRVNSDDLKGRNCLIVDDICDGGGTFIGLANELKKKNAGDLYLAVSHGIFSRGFDELLKYFKTIFTTNSFQDIVHENVIQFGIDEYL